jgi:hypothetical protein
MKKGILIFGVLLLVTAIAGASFWGGMTYQSNQSNRAVENFENLRGAIGEGMPSPRDFGNTQFPGEENVMRGGITGEIKSINGNVITLSTAQDVTTVNLQDSTRIQETVSVPVAELAVGMQVMVTGETDEEGSVSAVLVQIIDLEGRELISPPVEGMEP